MLFIAQNFLCVRVMRCWAVSYFVCGLMSLSFAPAFVRDDMIINEQGTN